MGLGLGHVVQAGTGRYRAEMSPGGDEARVHPEETLDEVGVTLDMRAGPVISDE